MDFGAALVGSCPGCGTVIGDRQEAECLSHVDVDGAVAGIVVGVPADDHQQSSDPSGGDRRWRPGGCRGAGFELLVFVDRRRFARDPRHCPDGIDRQTVDIRVDAGEQKIT